jgi:hypothetical protein
MGARCIFVDMGVFGNIPYKKFLNQDLQNFEDIFVMLDFDDQQRFYFNQNPVGANCIRPFPDRFQSNIFGHVTPIFFTPILFKRMINIYLALFLFL